MLRRGGIKDDRIIGVCPAAVVGGAVTCCCSRRCPAAAILTVAARLSPPRIPPLPAVLMYDDVAHSESNPHPGQLFNAPGGPDVYAGIQIVSCLLGDMGAAPPVRSWGMCCVWCSACYLAHLGPLKLALQCSVKWRAASA